MVSAIGRPSCERSYNEHEMRCANEKSDKLYLDIIALVVVTTLSE
jgi:hypothetical protein